MTSEPDIFLDYDAAYVLGALDPVDRRAYEQHLKSCRQCTLAVSELAGMPGLLAQVPAEQVLAPPNTEAPPDTLLPRMAAELRGERRRRRLWSGIVGAAATIVLIAGTVATTAALSSGPASSLSVQGGSQGTPKGNGTASQGSGSKPLALSAVTSIPVTASVSLDSVAWGTRVNLACTYHEYPDAASSGPVSTTAPSSTTGRSSAGRSSAGRSSAGAGDPQELMVYRLVVIPRDGGPPQQVAQWLALPDKTEHLTGATDLKPVQIREIQLQDTQGDMLLHVQLNA